MKEFKVKSSEEIAKLSEEDNAKYFAGLLDWQTKSIQELTEAKKSEEANKAELEKQINDLTNAQLKTMKSQLDTMGTAFAKLNKELEAKQEDKPLSFKAAIYKSLVDNKERIDSFLDAKSGRLQLNIKATQNASDIDAGTDYAQIEDGIGQIATRRTFMRDLFANRTIDREYLKYNDQETIVRDAKNVAGCASSTHDSKITWKVSTMQVQKVRDYVDVCIDMMEDYAYVESEIRDLVDTDVRLQVDAQLLLGDNVAPNLNSVDAVSSTFAAGSYAATVQTPTLVDLIFVAASQIADFGLNNKFVANVVLLNPIDVTKMKLEKDADNNYLLPNFITANGMNIGTVRIIENQLVPENEMYIFDSTKGVVYSRKGITVDFSFENTDNFEKELVTVKAYERLNFRVRNVDANAFMHVDDISAAITAITKP